MLVMHVAGGWDYVAVFNHSFVLSLSPGVSVMMFRQRREGRGVSLRSQQSFILAKGVRSIECSMMAHPPLFAISSNLNTYFILF